MAEQGRKIRRIRAIAVWLHAACMCVVCAQYAWSEYAYMCHLARLAIARGVDGDGSGNRWKYMLGRADDARLGSCCAFSPDNVSLAFWEHHAWQRLLARARGSRCEWDGLSSYCMCGKRRCAAGGAGGQVG